MTSQLLLFNRMTTTSILGLLIAALGGTAVGVERQWSGHAHGPAARFAGIRTFTMLGAIGGLSGWLWNAGATLPAAVLFAGAVAITAAAYVAGSRQDVDGTTEVAALVVLAAGMLAGMGFLRVASGIIALQTLLLVEKSRLHTLVQRIDDVGLRSGVRFAVMALVVLPLLPEGPYGPLGGVRPRELWALVLFFSGLSFAGYVTRRLVGPGHGYLATGLLGGLASSTNVTLTFARTSRKEPAIDRALAFGAVAANAMLYPRVLVATAVLNASVVSPLIPYLVPPALVAALATAWGLRKRAGAAEETALALQNPLELGAALQMAVLFQVVLVAVHAAEALWGDAGVFTTAAVLGLTDVDALTVSMARAAAPSAGAQAAAIAIAVGVLANTAMKLALALVLGSRRFRAITGGALLLMLVAIGAALALTACRESIPPTDDDVQAHPVQRWLTSKTGRHKGSPYSPDALRPRGNSPSAREKPRPTGKRGMRSDLDFRRALSGFRKSRSDPSVACALPLAGSAGRLIPASSKSLRTSAGAR